MGNQEPHPASPPGVNWTLEDVIQFVEACYDRDTILDVLMGYASQWFTRRMVLIVGRAWVQLFSTAKFDLPDEIPRELRRAEVDDDALAINADAATGTPEDVGLGLLFSQLDIDEPLVRTIGVTIGSRVAIVLVGALDDKNIETGALEAAASAAGRQLEDVIRMAKAEELPPEEERIPPYPEPRMRAPGSDATEDTRTTQNLAEFAPGELDAELQPSGPRMASEVVDDDSDEVDAKSTSFGLPFVEGEIAVPGRQVSESSAASEATGDSEASMTREGAVYRSEASEASEADLGTMIGAPTADEFPGEIDDVDASKPTELAEEPSDSEAIELSEESGVKVVSPQGINSDEISRTQLGGIAAHSEPDEEPEVSEAKLTDAGTQIGTPKKIGSAHHTLLGVGGDQNVVESTLERAESEAAIAAANEVLGGTEDSSEDREDGAESGKQSWMNARTKDGVPAAMILKPARKRRRKQDTHTKKTLQPDPKPSQKVNPHTKQTLQPTPADDVHIRKTIMPPLAASEPERGDEESETGSTDSGRPAVADPDPSMAATMRQERPPKHDPNPFDDNPKTQQLSDSDIEELGSAMVEKPPPPPVPAADDDDPNESSPPRLAAHSQPTKVSNNPLDSQVGQEESSVGTMIAAPNRTSLGGHFSRGQEDETRKFDSEGADDAWFDYFADNAKNEAPDAKKALNFSLSEPSDDPHTIPPETLERLLDSGPEMVDMQEQFMILDSRDRDKAFEAAERVAELGERSIEVLDLMFPGRVFLDRYQYQEDMPPVDKHGPVLHALVRLGDLALPVASRHLTDSSNEARFYAVYLLTKLDAEPVLPELFARLFDRDQQIRHVAAEIVLQYQGSRAFDDDVRKKIRDELLSGDDVHVTVASQLLAKLRDVGSVITLIDAMDDSSTPRVKVAILNALTEITLHHWSSPYEWRQWWRKAKNEKRRDWIVEALDATTADLRQRAYDEVQRIPGLELNYHPDQPSKLRKRAQKELRDWYSKT